MSQKVGEDCYFARAEKGYMPIKGRKKGKNFNSKPKEPFSLDVEKQCKNRQFCFVMVK